MAVEACLPRCLFTAVAAMARWAAAAAARLGRAAVAGACLGAGLPSAAAAIPRLGRASVPAAPAGSGVSSTTLGVASVSARFSASCRHGVYVCLHTPSTQAKFVTIHTLLCELSCGSRQKNAPYTPGTAGSMPCTVAGGSPVGDLGVL